MADYLTVKDVAQILGRTEKAIWLMVSRQQLPYRKFGARMVFSAAELQSFLDRLPGVSAAEALANCRGATQGTWYAS
jgi:hypothetical protein